MPKFLELDPESFGLDISDRSLKFARLKKKGRFFKLISWGETELKEGIIKDGEILDEAGLAEAIKRGMEKIKGFPLDTKNVIACLPESKAFLQVIKMPRMAKKDLEEAVLLEAENYIPLPIEKSYLDFQAVVSPEKSDTMEVLIAAISQKTANSYYSSLRKSGLFPQAMEVESQSIARALIKNGISDPLMIIDFGKSNTSFIIYSGNTIRFTSSIPVSSEMITEDISNALKIGWEEAEKMKIKYGLEKKRIAKAVEPSIKQLVSDIKKYLSYYKHRKIGPEKIDKVLLAGRGANLLGLSEEISSAVKIPVETGNPWVNIAPEFKEIPGLSFKESIGYTVAFGLALRGAQKDD
ncbi:MAG: hypothetical protein A2365_02675 [Candidatus Nealsonbacteria bacterium RIFOXYB1_FULL_40_15]|uniref:SHS2 domain-containing protein n=2 Tax=Candidatus Nealsoniibacteriota TaxID=1817911 RepID=A0A1G2EPM3_9BACT|nr:MAG: hypothetical protein A2365_02675 [Candidatus Nealsonbacteria bacterium RIFOXYB1_FULL_40_15]OGZ27502.1 MAG: hypothetical protein A2427_01530 [Candidatus Nealsonbacteria bacterium RIFOXYC1_FULL_40_7]OGZ28158.1 MAG: hypothetical protein A2562_02935 [Candidatus Nealsonbacteria bacterium RIFOXYD1_FULL_39_11]